MATVNDTLGNQWNFISILVWDAFHPDEPPTWYGSMEPVFRQYANLYPVMKQPLDLADYAGGRGKASNYWAVLS